MSLPTIQRITADDEEINREKWNTNADAIQIVYLASGRKIDTFANLRALSGDELSGSVTVLGKSAVDDQLGGIFYWNSGSIAVDDDKDTLAPDSGGTGRWLRLVTGKETDLQAEVSSINSSIATIETEKANADGSNLTSESVNEGNLDATSQAKLNANDGAFQSYHDCTGSAPSTAGLVANKDYYRVRVAGNGFTETDIMLFNGGSAGDYTDFTAVPNSAPLPADKSITQKKLDVGLSRRWDSAADSIWVGSVSNPTATSFDVTAGVSQVARYFFDVFEGQVVRVSFNATSLVGLSSLTLRESNVSTVMGDKNFGINDLMVGDNTIEFVAQKDQTNACVIFTYGSSNTGATVTNTRIDVYGDDDSEIRENRSNRSDVDSISAVWGGRTFRTTRFVRSGDVANALSDGFTVPANENSTGYYGNFTVAIGQTVTLTFDCDDGSAISQIRLSELDGTVASNQVFGTFLTGSNTVVLTSIFAGEVRVQFVVAASGSNVNITNFRCFVHGPGEARLLAVETLAQTNSTNNQIQDGRIDELDSLSESIDHLAFFSSLGGSFSDGSSAVATMPALDFGTKDHSVSVICARPAHSSIVWSNVSANLGEQLWWNGDGTFTLKIGNGANLTTHVFTTTNRAHVSVGELVRVFVTIRRAGDMVVYINEVPLHAIDGTIEFLDISSASAQTVSSGASWNFGSDGANHFPFMLLGIATFEEGAPPFSEVVRRKKNPALWRSTVYRSKVILDDFNWDDLSSPNAVLTNNVDDQAGEDDWIRLALEGDSDNTTHYLNIASGDAWFDSVENGDDLRIELLVYAPDSNTLVDALRIDTTASSSSETTQLVAVGFDMPTGYAYRLTGSGIVSGWSTDIGRLRIFMGSSSNTSTFGDGGSTEAIFLKQPILFVNGLKRIIDFSVSGLTKPDLIGGSDASRDSNASDLI
ncbi:MAG: hypothetical protein AAFX93_14160 [Verrucomicrobiota bacterium]